MQIGATAGWEIARTAWRRNHRRGLAFAVALGVNGLVILGFVASIQTVVQREGRAITVMIVPPFVFNKSKPVEPRPDLRPATQTARVHAAAPTLAPTPLPAPLPPSPLPKQQPPPAAVGKWTPTPDLHSRLDDQPSAQRYLRAGAACSKGELWKMSREEQDRCLARLGSKVPPDDGRHLRPAPPDPDGEFSRAAAVLEEQRRPMPSGPIGQCDIDVQGSNLHRFCAPSGQPH